MKTAIPIIIDVITALFVVLFLYAGVTKLIDYENFIVQIGQSPLLTSIAGFVAWFIPAVEIVIVLLLIVPRTRLVALYASFSLMLAFTGYIIAITRFSGDIPCSCGGLLQSMMSWTEHLIFNIVFVLLALSAIVLHRYLTYSKPITSYAS